MRVRYKVREFEVEVLDGAQHTISRDRLATRLGGAGLYVENMIFFFLVQLTMQLPA